MCFQMWTAQQRGGERNSGWGEKNNFSKLIEHQQYSFTSMQCLVTALGSKAPAD